MKEQLTGGSWEIAVEILCEIYFVMKFGCAKMHEGDWALHLKHFTKMFVLPLAKFVIDNKIRS